MSTFRDLYGPIGVRILREHLCPMVIEGPRGGAYGLELSYEYKGFQYWGQDNTEAQYPHNMNWGFFSIGWERWIIREKRYNLIRNLGFRGYTTPDVFPAMLRLCPLVVSLPPLLHPFKK